MLGLAKKITAEEAVGNGSEVARDYVFVYDHRGLDGELLLWVYSTARVAIFQFFTRQNYPAKFTLHLCLLAMELLVSLHRHCVCLKTPIALGTWSEFAIDLLMPFDLAQWNDLEAVGIADAPDLG